MNIKSLSIGLCACLALLVAMATPINAAPVGLQAYYEFEGNFTNSGGPVGSAAPSQNPGQVSFVGGGFRGQSVDINDPAANGGSNTGGSVDIPYNVSPANPVSFGGWFNLDSNAGFPGVVANDNGGWDRGIHMNGNNWGIASGGDLNNVAPGATGQWTYVVGTFGGGLATLYVGNDSAGTQTTATGSRPDNAAINGGLAVLEIGRYDNQDLDAKVDDFFIFSSALTNHQVNAIRNLRLSTLDYDVLDATTLLDFFNDGSGFVDINGFRWSLASNLAGSPGELSGDAANGFSLLLADNGNGLTAVAIVPEPTTVAMTGILVLIAGARRRRRNVA